MVETDVRRRRRKPAPWRPIRAIVRLASVLAVALALLLAGLWASGAPLHLPGGFVERIEARLARAGLGFDIAIDDIVFAIDAEGIPRLTVRGVALSPRGGADPIRLETVGAAFSPGGILRGRFAPRILRLEGLDMAVRRDAQGRLTLGFGGGGQAVHGPAEALDALDAALAAQALAGLQRIEIARSRVTLRSVEGDRSWHLEGGAALDRRAEGAELSLDLTGPGGATLSGLLTTAAGDSSAALHVEMRDVAASDLAPQSPALAPLALLDALISGEARGRLDAQGAPRDLQAALSIGAGVLRPGASRDPVPFDGARAALRFDPAAGRIDLDDVTLRGPSLDAALSGHAYLRDPDAAGFPRALLAQLDLRDLTFERRDIFGGPVRLARGIADLRVGLDPLELRIGQLVLLEGDGPGMGRIDVSGQVAAAPNGWSAALDVTSERLPREMISAFWPVPVAAKTRAWLDKYLHAAVIEDVTAALRLSPGKPPRSAANFSFRDASVTFLKQMPPITGGAGYGAFSDGRFVIRLEEGIVTPRMGGPLDLSGTTMTVPDIRRKPARGEFSLAADGSMTALLALLDRPPLNALKASGRAPDLAEAQVSGRAEIALELRKGNTPEDVIFDAQAILTDVSSDRIVKGRRLTAQRLVVAADPAALTVSGDAAIDGVATTFRWRQPLTAGARGRSRVTGSVALGPQTLRTFGVALPAGVVSGTGTGRYTLDLERGAPPALTLESALRGIALSVPALDWRKPAGQAGELSLSARLGAAPKVERIALAAAGLEARGSITAAPGGGLGTARLDRVRLRPWLDVAATVTGRGAGRPPAIALTGGRLDARGAPRGGGREGGGGRAGGDAAAHGPISLSLDTLRLTDTIALSPFTAQIDAGRGFDGRLSGRVNGGARVAGALVNTGTGTALRVTAPDGGAVLRDAGITERVHDGQMELRLQPTGAPGSYDGRLTVRGPRVRGAPALADLLAAISVVGLLEQLNGRGIVFEDATADFGLSPGRLALYSSSAVGASLGISMDGVYDLETKRMDMQGVVSPIYLLNGIGSIFTRRGEGLFGVSFTLAGSAGAPDVGVNPLSLLTPGMFREIFRKPPPSRN
ncbi:YhdP family protein [Profundibacterium mesophilum]|nr:AsmA-like C-terminal region-containing protein [Profundibacterium mesophilum]